MRRSTSSVRNDVPAFVGLACVVLLLASFGATADVSVYQSVVPMKGGSAADRSEAFAEALRSAAVRASGRRDAASNPAIAAAATDPSRYVQQYSTTPDRYLKVGFDAGAMDRLLQQAGLPVWPLERPVTQVLLVVDSVAGGTRAITDGERVPERTEVERAAQARGLPIAWPRGTVSAASVRAMVEAGGEGTGQDAAGGRAVLAGVRAAGMLGWRFSQPGQSARVTGSFADGIDLAADSLAARYAPPSTRGTSSITVRIGGIGDVRAYAGLIEYLKSLSLVRAIAVEEMTEQAVTLRLALRGDVELLRRIAALDGRLQSAAAPPVLENSAAVDFTFQP
jgi:hypothetical protein